MCCVVTVVTRKKNVLFIKIVVIIEGFPYPLPITFILMRATATAIIKIILQKLKYYLFTIIIHNKIIIYLITMADSFSISTVL